ncbi:hypothetical protein BC826DRAFT_111282 [Russula brevipes]|nr:hypothetical protein BC826DRAFT_111282 [Russula brevipes]
MTVTLDVNRSTDNRFESVRLCILWNMDMGHDGMQREIKMVDLDLFSFSGLDSQAHSTQGPSNGCLSRTGRRNLVPGLIVPATSPTSYRRFRVNLACTSGVFNSLGPIWPVCDNPYTDVRVTIFALRSSVLITVPTPGFDTPSVRRRHSCDGTYAPAPS